jgi:2-methylcitrate dehydratase PrpD
MNVRAATTASEKLAFFASAFRLHEQAAQRTGQVARALADTFAVAVAGANEGTCLRALNYVRQELDGGNARRAGASGSATLWGMGISAPPEAAALWNGIAAHVLDYDDVTSPMGGHPSVALLPALVALAEARGLHGESLVSAYIVGFEAACKLGWALGSAHYDKGWHTTSSIGTVAAATACAKLLGLDARGISNAIGLAVAQTAGTRENFGTDAKAFQAGQCGAAAVRAALLAEQGFSASATALDGASGYATLYSATDDLAKELSSLGREPLEIDQSGIEVKKYPACYVTHRPIDAVLDFKREYGLSLEDVWHVSVETSASGLAPLITHAPTTGVEGKFSLPYVIAAALSDGAVRLSSFTDDAVRRPDIRSFFGKVDAHEASGSMTPRWASVRLTLATGQTLDRHVDVLRGSPRAPLSDAQLTEKLVDCLSWGGSRLSASTLLDECVAIGTRAVRDTLDRISPQHEETT